MTKKGLHQEATEMMRVNTALQQKKRNGVGGGRREGMKAS